jgi:CRISPR-associated protein Cas2
MGEESGVLIVDGGNFKNEEQGTINMFVLVAYDIANDKRLRRVAKLMEDYGGRVQRSVFECRIGEKELLSLLQRMKTVLKKSEDKVTIYSLCGACRQRFEQYGQALTVDMEMIIC